MTNRGVHAGDSSPAWKDYPVAWRSNKFASLGAVTTQPSLGNGALYGRYLRLGSGFIMAEIQLIFGSTTTVGSTASFWAFSLPFPGRRANLGADLPIGIGLAQLGSAASPNSTQPLICTLADPADAQQQQGTQSDEDNWLQGFCQSMIATGSGAFTSGVATSVVTHNLGVNSGYIPNAYDINVVGTNTASTTPRYLWIDNITSTQFTVNVAVTATTTPLAYSWKIRGEPNNSGASILMGPDAPWAWVNGSSLSFQAIYEARR